MTVNLGNEPIISVAIMDRQSSVTGRLHGTFSDRGLTLGEGEFTARPGPGAVVLSDGTGREVARSSLIRLRGRPQSSFDLFNVTIGRRFHWERREAQTFAGDLVLRWREDGTVMALNEIPGGDVSGERDRIRDERLGPPGVSRRFTRSSPGAGSSRGSGERAGREEDPARPQRPPGAKEK